MKYSRKKIIIVSSLLIFFLFGSLSFLSKSQNNIFFKNNINLNKKDLTNQYLEAKVDPIYKVKTIRKTGNDEDRINVLFMNDNTNDSFQNDDYLLDYVNSKISIPWFSTKLSYVNNQKQVSFFHFKRI